MGSIVKRDGRDMQDDQWNEGHTDKVGLFGWNGNDDD